MATKQDARQIVLRAQSPFIGNAANEQLDVVFPRIDAEMAKLYEDRNILLTDGGIITFTGTQIQFTENLNLVLNQKISGAAPQVISLGSATVTLANNEMLWAVINRTAGTAALSQGTTMPAVIAANQEVFLIVKRVDAGDGTQRVYWRTGMALNAGQSVRLGSSGSGSGGANLEDLDSLTFRASFEDKFDEGPTDTKSAVDVTAAHTDSTAYNAAKGMYTLNYDASKTIAAATTTTTINISAVAAFTVKTGDMVINNGIARRITAVGSQSSFTTDAFPTAPTLASQVTISQAVHTKDIYNLAVDGNAISAAFPASTFQEILTDYEDTTTAGDNIFDVDVAPVVGYVASPDGTTFTTVNVRPTNETDTLNSVTLPSAGSALYFRFFANKSSGSGIVNLLRYKTFVQKSTSAGAVAGGITNSAYAFTNSVGTPINCAVSVVGGKTTLTLTWQYAVGVYSGTTASSIEVWLNGQKLPRFVNSTLTPDGSFLETSSNVVTLDKDYSSVNLSVEVFQRTQIVDNSTVNTTNISYQQEIMQNGFQAFVAQNQLMNATSSVGTPVAGSFYSTIVGRSAIVDLSQDMKVRMGVDRIAIQRIFQLQNEFGASGEPVFATPNDFFGQIRFVGTWVNTTNNYGSFINGSSTNLTDYAEVTFYGTGLNALLTVDSGAVGWSFGVSVDGGSESTVTSGATTSNVLGTRGYAPNIVGSMVSGLTLGVHTVKIRNNVSGRPNYFLGFEILNESSTLKINPGVSYVNGTKLTLSSQQSPAHNSSFDTGTLGTVGGHVVVYQKSDGTIGKAVTPTGSQANLSSADHTNEEIVRTHNWREFAAARADDWSNNTTGAKAFTLDDGCTTISTNNSVFNTNEGFFNNTNSDDTVITFIGTGLDIGNNSLGVVGQTYSIFVDGVSIGTGLTGASLGPQKGVTKIVSGLPYGSHCVRILLTNNTGNAWIINRLIIYQPKKPSIPSGATELADYNVLATFDATNVAGNAIADNSDMYAGVIYKSMTREMTYVGTWTLPTLASGNQYLPGGFYANTATNTDYVEHTFFGTGIAFHFIDSAGGTSTFTAAIDTVATAGATNKISITDNGAGSYTVNTTTGFLPARMTFTGLTLGKHTVRLTRTAGAGNFAPAGFAIITPIHSAKSNLYSDIQNSLPVGSQGISDGRKTTPVKDVLPAIKAWSEAVGTGPSLTTTSTSYVPLPEMSCTIKTGADNKPSAIRAHFVGWFTHTVAGADNNVSIYVDGLQVSGDIDVNDYTSGGAFSSSVVIRIPVSPGVHKVDVYWKTTSGTFTNFGRTLLVEEM